MSFKNEYTLNVDIKRRMTSVVPTFKQGDSATLKFKIFDDGKKFDLAAFTRAEITFKSPSGQTIVGEPYIDVNTQMIVYNFVGVEMNEAGKLTTILSIYSGTSMVSIQPFSIFIFDHLKDKDLSYIGILQDLIAEVQLLNEEVKSTLSEANNLKDELNNVLIEANSAEQTRNTSEQNRITSENTRISNENTRQQNEIDRKNAESVRESNEAIRIQNEQNRQNEFDNKINKAEVVITDTKNATEKANQAAESIKGWGQATVWNSTTTYSKNNVVTYNGSTWQSKGDNNFNSIPSESNKDWILLALRGVDGTGAVSTVNGKSPDGAGNVELTADEIGTYTQQQIDDKDTAVKEYFTDKGIGDKVIVISEQDYIDADYNGVFWVKNDTLDFLPTETDHAATLLVYENPDDGNVVKIFNVINPTTAISYMRTYTYDNTSSLIHDSGWIEGGGGSGTGGGNVSVNSYPLVTDSINQTIWELPTGIFNQLTDSVMVFHNTVFLEQVSYTLTNNRLSIPDNPHTEIAKNNVVLVVFRNMPNMKVEFDGNNIIDGSIAFSKLGQDVQDAINNAGTQVEIVNDLTTGGEDKALSAEQGKVLKKETDKAWKKGVYNDTDISNLGDSIAEKLFTIKTDDWTTLTNVEMFWLRFPVGDNFSGIIRVTYSSFWNLEDSSGGAIVTYQFGKYGSQTQLNDMTIESISQNFAKAFKVVSANHQSGNLDLGIRKSPNASNELKIKVEIQGISNPTKNMFKVLNDTTLHFYDTGSPTAVGYPWTPQTTSFMQKNQDNTISGSIISRNTFPLIFASDDTQSHVFHKNPNLYIAPAGKDGSSPNWGLATIFMLDGTVHMPKLIVDGVDLKQSVSNGKAQVASAITGKGVPTASDATFETMANNINAISTGKFATGSIPTPQITYRQGNVSVYSNYLDFKPDYIMTDWGGVVWVDNTFKGPTGMLEGSFTGGGTEMCVAMALHQSGNQWRIQFALENYSKGWVKPASTMKFYAFKNQ